MASKKIQLCIVNNSSVEFYRFKHELHGGTWLWQLPEVISPGLAIMIVGESHSMIAVVNGILQYSCVFYNVDLIVEIKFIIPILGNISLNYQLLVNAKPGKLSSQLEECRKSFNLMNVGLKGLDSFEILINESMEGHAFIQARRLELYEQLRRLQAKYLGAIIPYEALQKLPRHFIWNVRNVDWQKALKDSFRSVVIRIVNLTQYTMELMNDKSTKAALYEGKWMEFPSERIPPMCFTEFGGKSGRMTGISGVCFYNVLGTSSNIFFSWEHSGLSPLTCTLTCTATHSSSKFSIPFYVDELNDGFITFHVIDPSFPPRIHVESAIAIPAKIVAHVAIQELDNFVNCNVPRQQNLVQELLDFVEDSKDVTSSIGFAVSDSFFDRQNHVETLEGGYSSGVIRLAVSSPRAFFWTLVNRSMYKETGEESLASINPTNHLFLKWRIGCEVFYHVWKADEQISLNSLSPGGFEDANVVKRAQVLQFRSIPPLELFSKVLYTPVMATSASSDALQSVALESDESEEAKGEGSSKCESVTNTETKRRVPKLFQQFDFSDEGIVDVKEKLALRHAYLSQSTDMLVGVAFECFRALSSGLQPIIIEKLHKKYGMKWGEVVKLPPFHIWSEQSLDLEYLLRLMVEHMDDAFISSCGKEAIRLLQMACQFWYSQITEAFTLNFVIRLCRFSRKILLETGAQDVVSTVENLLHVLGEDLESKHIPEEEKLDKWSSFQTTK